MDPQILKLIEATIQAAIVPAVKQALAEAMSNYINLLVAGAIASTLLAGMGALWAAWHNTVKQKDAAAAAATVREDLKEKEKQELITKITADHQKREAALQAKIELGENLYRQLEKETKEEIKVLLEQAFQRERTSGGEVAALLREVGAELESSIEDRNRKNQILERLEYLIQNLTSKRSGGKAS